MMNELVVRYNIPFPPPISSYPRSTHTSTVRRQFRPVVSHISTKRRNSRSNRLPTYSTAEEEEDGYLTGDVDDAENSSSMLLSLSVKPDRNMSLLLLDEYEMEEMEFHPDHRSGYVAVVGKPNVGKSTLSNQMVGQKLSIVTDKPQTTRHRILGICSAPDFQVCVFLHILIPCRFFGAFDFARVNGMLKFMCCACDCV